MKRDMDFVRDLLLEIEDGKDYFQTDEMLDDGSEITDAKELALIKKTEHHIGIMLGAGLIEFDVAGSSGVFIKGLTWQGHDFLDTIRDPAMWRKTREGASKLGGAGFAMIVEFAKSVAKGELQKLGLPLP